MSKDISILELSQILKGRIIGGLSGETRINGTCAIDNYIPHKVSFIKNEKYSRILSTLNDAIVLINEDDSYLCRLYPQNTYILVEDAVNSIFELQYLLYKDELSNPDVGISRKARIHGTARVGKDVFIDDNVIVGKAVVIGAGTKIMANSVIMEHVTIGENATIYPNVIIYKNCEIGNEVVLRSGVCIGADGYRYEQNPGCATIQKMYQMGSVIIGDRVEIGCNTVICRGTFEGSATTIGDDVKISDLVGISHNVKIGARTIIIALSTIAGSTKIGEDVWIGSGVSIANGVTVGHRTKVLLNAVVAYDIPDNQVVSGFYAMPHKQWKLAYQMLKEYNPDNANMMLSKVV